MKTAKAVIKFDKGTITLRSGKSKISFHRIPESLGKVEKGIKNDIKPIAPTMTVNKLVLEWEEKIKLHLEKEMKFDQWRSKNFKNKHPAPIKVEGEMDEGEVTKFSKENENKNFAQMLETTSGLIVTTSLYLIRRSLEVLKKFHWMILGGRFNQLSQVSPPLLSKPGEYYFLVLVFFSLYSFLRHLDIQFGGNARTWNSFGEEMGQDYGPTPHLVKKLVSLKRGDGVAGIKRRRRDLSSDGVHCLGDCKASCEVFATLTSKACNQFVSWRFGSGYQMTNGIVSTMPNTSFKNCTVAFSHKCSGQLHSLEVVINDEEDRNEEVFDDCGTELVLLRRTPQSYVKWMQGPEVKLNSMTLCVYPSTLLSLEAANGSCAKHPCSKIQTLLKEYEDVFSMPNALPSKRSHDHHIPLISNASPVNIKPYRHPPNQKDAIELMAKELLDSWINKYKTKDKFPILMIEELIYELKAMLQQEGHPIDYLSKALSAKHQSYLTYEKEFLAVILALEKWRGYLMDKHFKIKTDHFSLKYLLDQRVTTPFQAKWLPKLSGYDYEISYKKGSHNVVTDALSRVPSCNEESQMFSLITTTITSPLWEQIKDS
ncbi:reverse transcriptase [Tanacetum coccineum]